MKDIKRILMLTGFLLTFPLVVGAESPLFLESKLMSLDSAGPPEHFSGNIILTYHSQSGWPIRHVGARFEHEDFKVLHTYTKNDNGVFFLVYSVPEDCACLKYRIVVDGLWMKDPFNPHTINGGLLDVEYSFVEVTEYPSKEIANPERLKPAVYRFVYKAMPGESVSIIGDFNNWDPFRNILHENPIGSGVYQATLIMGPGEKHYTFMVNGIRVTDPFNTKRMSDKDGQIVSYFVVLRE